MSFTLHTGDSLAVLPTLAKNSVDAIVTDPPYGLGFMGKAWDHDVPGVEFWLEMLRVAKPGSYLLAFGGTRKVHRMACAIEDAGWEIRDRILWLYGSGFPKSLNLGDGRGTALKPAHEPIIMARKPLVGTVAANVLAFGTGALNIDACRVPTNQELRAGAGGIPCRHDENVPRGRAGEVSAERTYAGTGGTNFAMAPGPRGGAPTGRWPANVIHDGSDAIVSEFPVVASGVPSGVKASGQGNAFGMFAGGVPVTGFGDSGSAARFFYCPKASRKDRNEGLGDMPERPLHWSAGSQSLGTFQAAGTHKASQNNHPTVKPVDLMRYLCRLVTPLGGLILDPFMGSGSTGKAAMLEGFRFIGIEREADYTAIAHHRILHACTRKAA